jgi:hypothetical protein
VSVGYSSVSEVTDGKASIRERSLEGIEGAHRIPLRSCMAGSTLLEYFSEQRPLGEQSADTLSEDELDAEIARLKA